MSDLVVPDVKKIAILRSGALGDFIVTVPAIKAIKETYPDAEVTLLGKPWLKNFLQPGRIAVDKFIEVPIIKGIREEADRGEDKSTVDHFVDQMVAEQFDIVLQFQGKGISANSLINKFGARFTVGMVSPESAELSRSIPFYYYQSEALRYLEVASLIGAKTTQLEPEIAVLTRDMEEADIFISPFSQGSFIVLHPFAMDVRRSWPLEKFGELAESLYHEGFQVVFSGSSEDKGPIDLLISQIKTPALNSCGQLSLGGLSALLSKSRLVISSDTGPLHLARAVGAKTVGIYWAPNLINWGPLSRKNHRPVVSWKMECPICGVVPNDPYPFEPVTETCDHNLSFVREIKVEAVFQAAQELFMEQETTGKRKDEPVN